MAALIVLQPRDRRATAALPAALRPRRHTRRSRSDRAPRRHRRAGDPYRSRDAAATDYRRHRQKLFITNGREGNTPARSLAITDPSAQPRHRGMSSLHRREGPSGFRVAKSIAKLGYKGVDTAELIFDECVGAGGQPGRWRRGTRLQARDGRSRGRAQSTSPPAASASRRPRSTTRVSHVAARSDDAPPALADMATELSAPRGFITYLGGRDEGPTASGATSRPGMAKLFASEIGAGDRGSRRCASTPMAATLAAPQRRALLSRHAAHDHRRGHQARSSARSSRGSLIERHGERLGALTSHANEPAERRQMVLAVRQSRRQAGDPGGRRAGRGAPSSRRSGRGAGAISASSGRSPIRRGEVSGSTTRTAALIVEELARGSAVLAAIVTSHFTAVHAIARGGTEGSAIACSRR